MRTLLHKVALVTLLGCNLSADMLIDPTTLNGSFDAGEVTPWSVGSGGDSIVAVEDENVTYDGVWYAEIGIDTGRAYVGQFIASVAPTVADTFTLSFQARKGSPGPGSISAGMSSYKTDGDSRF